MKEELSNSLASLLHNIDLSFLGAKLNRQGERKKGNVYANLVSTFCYLSLEGELRKLLHGRSRQRLLRGHPHAAKYNNDHSENEEYAARHVDEDVGVVVLLLGATLCHVMVKNIIIRISQQHFST